MLCVRKEIDTAFVDKFIQSAAAARATPAEALGGYRGMILGTAEKARGTHDQWNARQVYIALGFLLESAALLGIDACPMEGFDTDAYNNVLNLSDRGYTAVVACALGYRSPNDKYAAHPKVRYQAS
ncbi:NAD(P)H-dependent oxidoreductase, partial [Corallococcus sp. AB049A]